MRDESKTKKQLIEDVVGLRYRLSVLEDYVKRFEEVQEEFYLKQEAFESNISAIGITDLEGKLKYLNKACVKMWGYGNKDEMIGKALPEFWYGDRVLETIENLKKRGYDKGVDTGVRKDGTHFKLLFSANVIKNKNGIPVALLGIFMDITKRMKAEEEVKEQLYEIESMNKLMAGRELIMVNLKKRVKELEKRLEEFKGLG